MASQITNLTNFADQVTVLQLADGSTASLELIFNGTTGRWVMIVTYPTLNFNTGLLGACCHPNILRQWRNIIPFGLSFVTAGQTDPFNINDFLNQRVLVYLLNAADVLTVENTVFGNPVQI